MGSTTERLTDYLNKMARKPQTQNLSASTTASSMRWNMQRDGTSCLSGSQPSHSSMTVRTEIWSTVGACLHLTGRANPRANHVKAPLIGSIHCEIRQLTLRNAEPKAR